MRCGCSKGWVTDIIEHIESFKAKLKNIVSMTPAKYYNYVLQSNTYKSSFSVEILKANLHLLYATVVDPCHYEQKDVAPGASNVRCKT